MESFSTREVARLLGLSETQVRSQARAGFLSPERGPRNGYRFSFQDLVLLRTARELAQARVRPRRIRRVLCGLARQLPRGRSLSEIRITPDGQGVLVRDDGNAWNPESGQMHIDFSAPALPASPAEKAWSAVPGTDPEGFDAWELFDLALELEAADPAAAFQAYARALAADPTLTDAHVNLGRLLQLAGRTEDAIGHYLASLRAGSTDPTAAFNLGTALARGLPARHRERWELRRCALQSRSAPRPARTSCRGHSPPPFLQTARGIVNVRIGTSGWSYKEWKGGFYPEKFSPREMLPYYASRFSTVEVNNSFYRIPSERVLATWADQVPADFRFVMKASRRITHHQRLRDEDGSLSYFLQAVNPLGPRLGPTLFQLPPTFKKDTGRLKDFLEHLPHHWPAAMEFRHVSWFDDEVYHLLRQRDIPLVAVDQDPAEGGGAPLEATAGWGYLRLRRTDYDEPALSGWAERIVQQPWQDAYVFLKHEEGSPTGPAAASALRRLLPSSSQT
jgi:uncharacterized protein YecE (DUF72 family)